MTVEFMIRFLEKEEYFLTIPLFEACFGSDPGFMRDYYGDEAHPGDVFNGRIAVKEEDGRIVSMVHLKPVTAVYRKDAGGELKLPVTYIMGVSTLPDLRHRGYMDEVMGFVMDALQSEGAGWCFLIAVNKDIYRHLGFVYDWKLSDRELELLYADDGLEDATACVLCDMEMKVPDEIRACK